MQRLYAASRSCTSKLMGMIVSCGLVGGVVGGASESVVFLRAATRFGKAAIQTNGKIIRLSQKAQPKKSLSKF